MSDWLLGIIGPVLVFIISRFVWRYVGGLKWENEIPGESNSFWLSLGYYIDGETNQWSHKFRSPIGDLIEEEESNISSRLASGYSHVRTKWLKLKVFTFRGMPSKKVYFLEPPSRST